MEQAKHSTWLFRHANVKSELVTAALNGAGNIPLEALRRLTYALDAEITLIRAPIRFSIQFGDRISVN